MYEEEKAEKEQMAQEQMDAEETWKELENELEKEIDDLTKEKTRVASECAELKTTVETERSKKDEISKQLDSAQAELQKLKTNGSDSRATVQKLEQQNDSLSQRDRINQASLNQVKEQLETVQEEKFLLEQQLLEIENDSKQKLRNFEEQLVEAKGDVEVKDALVHKLQTKMNVMEALGEQLAIAKADKEKDSLIQKLQTQAEDSDALRAELSEAKKDLAAKDSMIQKLQTQVQETNQELAKANLKTHVPDSEASNDQLPKELGKVDNKDALIQNLQSQLNDTDKLREELAVNIRKTLIQKFQAGVKALGNQLTKAKRDLKAKDSLVQKLQRSLGAQLAKAKGELEAKNAQIKKLKQEMEDGKSSNIPLMSIPDAFENEISARKHSRDHSNSRVCILTRVRSSRFLQTIADALFLRLLISSGKDAGALSIVVCTETSSKTAAQSLSNPAGRHDAVAHACEANFFPIPYFEHATSPPFKARSRNALITTLPVRHTITTLNGS